LYSIGDYDKITYWRSAAKPIQVLPILLYEVHKKYQFTDQEIVIMASSYNVEEKHIRLILSMLDKINLTERDLKCGMPFSVNRSTAVEYHKNKKGVKFSPIYNPCSGKHAA